MASTVLLLKERQHSLYLVLMHLPTPGSNELAIGSYWVLIDSDSHYLYSHGTCLKAMVVVSRWRDRPRVHRRSIFTPQDAGLGELQVLTPPHVCHIYI